MLSKIWSAIFEKISTRLQFCHSHFQIHKIFRLYVPKNIFPKCPKNQPSRSKSALKQIEEKQQGGRDVQKGNAFSNIIAPTVSYRS